MARITTMFWQKGNYLIFDLLFIIMVNTLNKIDLYNQSIVHYG